MHERPGVPSALLTDLYELTMAYGFWRSGQIDTEAVFHLSFRKNPFGGGFSVAAGLAAAACYLEDLHFGADDLAYLGGLVGDDGRPLFERAFLEWLGARRFELDVDAVLEGTVVFPHEPLLRVKGPLIDAQIVESALLDAINFPTLVATKAARMAEAARGGVLLEFGLRRAQGPDGALTASRAAYVGGCDATSNVLAGKLFGFPVRGTHAHSWVMAHDDEEEAFEAWGRAMPNNAVFLVDTYDSIDGVRKVISVAKRMRERGHEFAGIRLDSGDLAWLSQEARRLLDDAGFEKAKIVASNDMDEEIIQSLREQGARIDVWGVGTRLVTGWDQPALGGVYKLGAIRRHGVGPWVPRIKVSENTAKVSIPGILQVRRFRTADRFLADMIFDEGRPPQPQAESVIVHPSDPVRRHHLEGKTAHEDLLVPILRGGRRVWEAPPLAESRARTAAQLSMLHAGIKRFKNPHEYPAGIERSLHETRTELILATRGG